MDFKGRAKRLDDIDLPKLGALLGVGEDELHAFIDVETRGEGFDEKNRPTILFERHKFWKYLPADKRKQAQNLGLASPTPGGYGKYADQYPKLEKAMKIDQKAALYSCSWGLAQIMGFNHEAAGYATVEDMIEAFKDDEENHLLAAVRFIKTNNLDDELRRHDWAGFAKGYNGANYKKNEYDTKLATAYRKWSRIKDTPWKPDEPEVVVVPPSPEPPPKVVVVEDNPPPGLKVPTGWRGISVTAAMILSVLWGAWGEIKEILQGVF